MLAYDYVVERPQELPPPQRLCPSWQGTSPTVVENDLLAASSVNHQLWAESRLERNSFFDERRRNVTENKGPPWKRSRESGNVYENKGT